MLDTILNLDDNVEVIHYSKQNEQWDIILKLITKATSCPSCNCVSTRIHSKYTRRIQDLPMNNLMVCFTIQLNKWYCDNSVCQTKIFTERLSWLESYRRRTKRCEDVLRKIAFSTSCLQAEKISYELKVPASNDTLLRIIKNTFQWDVFFVFGN
ncbi:hypothetical protein BKP45_10080 [Anaerobacillus alkalidiazotrophicus]|uniref:Transposase IS204/IS1001/IS1096/IS1165 zinc-finger domain-containing protein n=1 Tax=Anaerobacillus alkalidiazotrophicus TaxID=472963 RepID=A0A1S2M685_9BACI|nr:transposase family protein [Anaerobacillus alkalidiazotrophicus]OIJ20126.1 hypothetical protein BKP45_10080 [Anaerobacillus alkalidiazotrophicus]